MRYIRTWSLLEGCLVFVMTGCANQQKKEEPKDEALTAEIAKKALVEIYGSQIPPGVMVRPPTVENIEVLGAEENPTGGWTINLKEKTFHASFSYPNAFRHKHNEVTGVFRLVDGKWVAEVTHSASGG